MSPEGGTGPREPDESGGPLSFEPESAEAQARRWAHRQDPDLEAGVGENTDATAPPPRPRSPYGWLFALAVGLVLVYISVNTLRNVGSVPRGVAPGKPLPPFAAPLATGRLEGDANVATKRGQAQVGKRPACEVRGREIVNSCQLTEGSPAVLAFIHTGEPSCAAQLDTIERVRKRYGSVRFAAVTGGTDRSELRPVIRRRGWRFPIAYDRDGAVFTLYGVVDCPTLTFTYPGGIAMRTTLKPLDDRQLGAMLQRLVDGARQRGWKPPAPA